MVEALRGRPGPAVLLFPRSIWTADVPPIAADFADRIRAAIRPTPIYHLGPLGSEDATPAPQGGLPWSEWGRMPGLDVKAEAAPQPGAVALASQPARLRFGAGVPANPHAVRRGLIAMLQDLHDARHPVLIVGQGVRRCSNPAVVIEFARAVRLPMMTDLSASGEVPNDDPLYLGMLGVAGHPSAHHYLRDRADLLFLVGFGFNAMTRAPFLGDPRDITSKKLLAVNIDMGELSRAVEPGPTMERSWWPGTASTLHVAMEADAGVVFEELLRLWREHPFQVPPPGPYQFEQFRSELAPEVPLGNPPLAGEISPERGPGHFAAGPSARWTPRLRCRELRGGARLHQLYVPRGASATIALGMGGMGYAIAAATGIAIGSTPDRRTMVFTGDGALLMGGFEIHTAVALGLRILFVVFNNAMHGMCVMRQQKFFEGRLECVRYPPVDVAAVARGARRAGSPLGGVRADARRVDGRAGGSGGQCRSTRRSGTCAVREEIPPFTPLLPKGTQRIESPPPIWEWD